jgi:predicted extracellular nuclease
MVHDVTDPANASFVTYKPPAANDQGPEVDTFVSAADSPTGTPQLLSANEVSGTTTVYAVLSANFTQEVGFTAESLTVSHSEGDAGTTPLSFTVERTNGTLGSVDFTVQLTSMQANTADLPGIAALPHTINGTIAAGQSSAMVTVNVAGDTVFELHENFTLSLQSASTAQDRVSAAVSATQASATGTIVNDDFRQVDDIQGTGHLSPFAGQIVTTRGIVTAIDTNGSRGFYIQDANGDGNAATADGIFVFLPSGTLPTVGRQVEVTGTVQEFNPSGAAIGSFSTTELSSVTSVVDFGAGPAVAPVLIGGPGGVLPPTESVGCAIGTAGGGARRPRRPRSRGQPRGALRRARGRRDHRRRGAAV